MHKKVTIFYQIKIKIKYILGAFPQVSGGQGLTWVQGRM